MIASTGWRLGELLLVESSIHDEENSEHYRVMLWEMEERVPTSNVA
jgi:hypothetical protein